MGNITPIRSIFVSELFWGGGRNWIGSTGRKTFLHLWESNPATKVEDFSHHCKTRAFYYRCVQWNCGHPSHHYWYKDNSAGSSLYGVLFCRWKTCINLSLPQATLKMQDSCFQISTQIPVPQIRFLTTWFYLSYIVKSRTVNMSTVWGLASKQLKIMLLRNLRSAIPRTIFLSKQPADFQPL